MNFIRSNGRLVRAGGKLMKFAETVIDKIKHAVLGKCILGEMVLGQEEEM